MQDEGISEASARQRFYGINRSGPITENAEDLRPE